MRRLIRTLLTAVALAGMVALLVQLAPEATDPAADRAAGLPPPQAEPEESLPGSPVDSVPRVSRDVTPPGLTGPQGGEGALARLPPRPPLTEPTPAEAEAASEIRLRLLHRPVAIDTGTIGIGRGTIALAGIAALPLASECGTGAGRWPCGMLSRTALRSYLRARSVRCEAPEDFGETEAAIESRCTLGGEDVGDWIVRNGWATAADGGPYAEAEAEARDNRRGIWRGGP